MGQFERKIISFEVTVTEIFRQNKHNKLVISNSKVQMCGFMKFVYIVQNLILWLKTILCISLINIWFLVETYMKLIRNFRGCFDIFCIFLGNQSACFQKFSFLVAVTYCAFFDLFKLPVLDIWVFRVILFYKKSDAIRCTCYCFSGLLCMRISLAIGLH